MTVEVFGFFATQARASAAGVVWSSGGESHHSDRWCATDTSVSTILSEFREFSNFADLFHPFLLLQGVRSRVIHRVYSEAGILRDAVVVLCRPKVISMSNQSCMVQLHTFPVSSPAASEDHVVVPRPYFLYSGLYVREINQRELQHARWLFTRIPFRDVRGGTYYSRDGWKELQMCENQPTCADTVRQ
jgi:hypothetical protein